MAVLFLLLFLCGTPQAADNIQAIYVALGEAMELPCPSPPTLHGDEHLSWFRSPAAGSFTTLVAQVQVGRPAPDPGKPGRESRLRLLGNYSLWLEGSKEDDAGRYWCAVLGQHHNYQNWRVYDVLVLKGYQLSARAADGSPCNVLLCSVVPSRRMDSVTWQEGKGPVRGRVQSFWGSEAALLLVCPGEGLSEHRSRRPRIIRCLMTHNKGVSFSLAASMDASPALCTPSMGWDMPWILMLLLTIGQGVIILALSIVLWRQRVCGAPGRAASIPQFKPEIQVYENIHLARLGKPNAVLQLWWKPQQFLQRSRQTPARPGTDQATWKPEVFFEGAENSFGLLEITSALPQKASPEARSPTPQFHSLSQPQ
uniref:Lymphocyte antigen 6 family member G6F n=1 Tax=Rhinopithecus roxellana TaxID=61622 RepID=A0A2K6PYQ7_RHIRO